MPKVGDVYCVWDEPFGVWLAFQVWKPYNVPSRRECEDQLDKLKNSHTGIIMLDWFSEKFPDESDMTDMKEFRRLGGAVKGMTVSGYISGDIPVYCKYLGNREPVCSHTGGGYGRLSNEISVVNYEQRWRTIPEEYRCIEQGGNITVRVKDDLNKLSPQKIPIDLTLFGYIPENFEEIAAAYPVVSRLCLAKLRYEGILDLSRTYIRELDLDISGLDELILPKTLSRLNICGVPKENFNIRAFENGRRIDLRVEEKAIFPKGLERCHAYSAVLTADEFFDIERCVSAYPKLYSLCLWGEFGTLGGFSALSELKTLREFLCTGFYGFSGEDFPSPEELPDMGEISVFDVPKEALEIIKLRWKKARSVEKYFRCGRTEEWLKENRDNPLRMWQGREQIPPAKAKRAAKIYRDLRSSAFEAAECGDISRLEELFRSAAEHFYALDKKGEFLETVELEELYIAVNGLVDEISKKIDVEFDRERLLKGFDGMY